MAMPLETQRDIADEVGSFWADPLGFVYWCFPWGAKGTPLEKFTDPEDWQIEILRRLGEQVRAGAGSAAETRAAIQIAVSSGHGCGKPLKYNEIVYTPAGYKQIGMLLVGDFVLGGDGRPCRVTGVYPQGPQQLYRVSFSDGSSVLAGGTHQWAVKTNADRARGKPARVVTTDEMRGQLHRKYQIPMCGAAEFAPRPVDVDPYVLGYSLANGNLCTQSAVRVSCYDEGVFDEIDRRLPDGYGCHGSGQGGRYRHISQQTGCFVGDANPIWHALERYGLARVKSHEKFIPTEYLYNTVESRIDLLRGLMDGDGCVSPRKGRPNGYRCVFSTSSAQLRDDVVWLVQSLGGVAGYSADDRRGRKIKIAENHATTNHINYQVSINLPNSINPFFVERKLAMYELWVETTKREPIRAVVSIEAEEVADAYCIAVDNPESLYLTKDFIVTHNTALINWIILWFMSTRTHPHIVVTANTKPQLQGKTWSELAKWHGLAINRDWFKRTKDKLACVWAPDTWFTEATAWDKASPQSFAGTHGDHVLMIFDEGSEIPEIIWEVTEGALTVGECIWIVFGNPTLNTGRFRECWRQMREFWSTMQVDSRTVRITNKKIIERQIKAYGEDSDFVRIRVLGLFPRASVQQLIGDDIVMAARERDPAGFENAPLQFGIDCARFGDDQTVLYMRQGAATRNVIKWRGLDEVQIADKVTYWAHAVKPHQIVFDGSGGYGAGAYDLVRRRGFEDITYACNFGSRASSPERFKNKRIEMWWRMMEWLRDVGCIDDRDQELYDDLIGPVYFYASHSSQLQLESKQDMKDRQLPSPDTADALALTFAYPVHPLERERPRDKLTRNRMRIEARRSRPWQAN